jgi:GH15 family glucan-1,4-alpha-glucosidase
VPEAIDAEKALAATEQFWTEWSSQNTENGQHRTLVQRSLITLKALTFVPTGGIVAAPTTSLPERIGGARNWDYRYCWIRDATFTLLALLNNGYTDEARDWHSWLLRAVAGSPRNMQIMYSITGQRRLLEWEASWLPGYERSRPVRIGNAAHAQLQLDVFGELMDTFHQARKAHVKLDEATWALECALLGHLAEAWDRPDAGLWETRGLGEHYVFSKVMCWVAFDRGIKSARQFKLQGAVEKWCAVREQIRADILSRGFDAQNNTFVEAYGRPYLDGSLALLPTLGFIEPNDPRMRGTIEAIERHMMREGFVLRHDPRMKRPGELEPIEGAFLACTLWLADAHILMGNLGRARELFDRVVAIANDVGLLAEQYDPISRRQTGNFPQALTHIALINTAANIHNATQPAKQPNVQRSK